MKCPRCGLEMENGRCPSCGYTTEDVAPPSEGSSPSDSRKDFIKNFVTILAASLFLGYLILNAVMVLWSVNIILPETFVNEEVIFIVLPIPIGLFKISGYWFATFYLFLVGTLLLSLITIFYTGIKDFFLYFKEVLSGRFDKIKNKDRLESPLLRLVCIFTALLFITYIYLLLLEFGGRSPTSPGLEDQPIWWQIYSLTRAVVWEEIVVRMAFIGLPMLAYAAIKGKRKLRKYLLGGFGFNSWTPAILVLVSSSIFAMAHLPGWDIYKMFPTFIAGLAFGYLFVKDGLHSAIMLHFFWNFMSVPDKVVEISDFNLYLSLMILFWMIVGSYYTYYYIKKLAGWIRGAPKKEEKKVLEQEKREQASYTAGVDIGYVCPNCGYNNARYTEDDKLECERCGTKNDPTSNYAQQHTGKVSTDRDWPPS
ncbi:MAG: CPBP family intramembrane metalloprotease [Candidatus Thermoplasmatota archaeon]|nr:CPBP family intramembrane metalloprotease [Candidatus Thermoplasmatota archaeon]